MKLIILTVALFLLSCEGYSQIDTVKEIPVDNKVFVSTSPIDNPARFTHYEFKDFEKWLFYELNNEKNVKDCANNPDFKVNFKVTSSGKVIDIEVIENPISIFKNGQLTASCIILVENILNKSSSYWTGGSHNGKPVTVLYSIPVRFK